MCVRLLVSLEYTDIDDLLIDRRHNDFRCYRSLDNMSVDTNEKSDLTNEDTRAVIGIFSLRGLESEICSV